MTQTQELLPVNRIYKARIFEMLFSHKKEFLKKNRSEAKKVSIYEYDEEKHLRMEREDAKADGIVQGIEIGKNELLKSLVKKKLQKSKSDEQIAEELEEDVDLIRKIKKELEE